MQTIRTLDTPNSTFFVSFGTIHKTSYEERVEHRAGIIRSVARKLGGLSVIALGVGGSYLVQDGMLVIVCSMLGTYLILSKQKAVIMKED